MATMSSVKGVSNAGTVDIRLTSEEWLGFILYGRLYATVRPLSEAPAEAVISASSVPNVSLCRVFSRLSTLLLPLRWLCCHL